MSAKMSVLKRRRTTERKLARAVEKAKKRGVFLLLQADGEHVFGRNYAELGRLRTPPGQHLLTSFPWSSLAGDALMVNEKAVYTEMTRSFEWSDFMIRCAKALLELRGGFSKFAQLALSPQTTLALTDDWPLSLHFPTPADVQQGLHRIAPATSTATGSGFLALMSLALRNPWMAGKCTLSEPKASQRFRRLGMICTDLADPPERVGPYKTARVMLDVFRTRVFEHGATRLVRAHRMYAELLPELHPEVCRVFEDCMGMGIHTWVLGLCMLHDILQHRTQIDIGDGTEDFEILHAAKRLAVTPSWFQSALAGRPLDTVTPFRESPILTLENGSYLILHQDYLLSAADEGVVARLQRGMNPSQKSRLNQVFGDIFQIIVKEALQRCFGACNVHDVPTAKKKGGVRCDFAVVCGGDLLLVDAKRLLLGDRVIDGIDNVDCLAPVLQYGMEQIAQTASAMRDQGCGELVPSLGEFNPRRFLGWLVVQPDLPFSYESRLNLVTSDPELEVLWKSVMTGSPCVVPIAGLDCLEAAGMQYMKMFLGHIAHDNPLAGAGIPQFLSLEGYDGPQYSSDVTARYRKLISESGF